ncbi:hypothetical protein [Comamonas kerstersii]
MSTIANFPDIRPSLVLDFSSSGCVDPRIQCVRASAATCYGPDGKRRTVAAGVPRIDLDPMTGKSLGLLTEETRTNLWLNSASAASAQSFPVTAQMYTLSFEGGGTIALSGSFSGALVGGSARVQQSFTAAAGTLVATPSGDVRNVQLEVSAFATSYIPTGGAAVTRVADMMSMLTDGWLNALEGTMFVEWMSNARFSGFSPASLVNSISPSQNRYLISGATTSSSELASHSVIVNTGGAQVFRENWAVAGATRGVFHKDALSYSSQAIAAASDGRGVTGAPGPLPVVDRLILGNGYVKRFLYYPRAFPQEILQRLTA